MITPDERAWNDALDLFAKYQRRSDLSEGTIALRSKHLARFQSEVGRGVWAVTYDDIADWLDDRREGGWSDQTVRVHRSTITTFYRWAHKFGHCADNPAAGTSRRPEYQSPPEPWVQPLADYQRYLFGLGRTRSTALTRTNAVRRFARENPSLGPWDATFDDLMSWLGGKRWASETRKLHRDALRSFYRWAVDSERTERNPAERIPPIRGRGPMPRPVVDEVYTAALAKADRRERLALRLAAELGLRRGEVAQVHSRDIQPDGDDWALIVHGKGAKDRVVPLTFGLATALRSQPYGYLFPGGDGGHISAAWLGRIISQTLPPGVSMHALRHRFATRAYGVDRDVFTVQQLLGHASPATTQRYVQVSNETKRRLVEALA